MMLYAETHAMRVRQITIDVLTLIWTVAWVRAGMWVHDLVAALTRPGVLLQEGGSRFARTLADAGSRAEGVPVVGPALSAPLDAASDAGRAVQRAGAAQQEAVLAVALVIGIAFAVLPVLLALTRWLPWRLRWVIEATAGRAIRDASGGLHLFALRAVANRPLSELRRVSDDPAGALRSGNVEALARLELGALGLRA